MYIPENIPDPQEPIGLVTDNGSVVCLCAKLWRLLVMQVPTINGSYLQGSLHCALDAVQCIVISSVCGLACVFVCGSVCYHDNSKLRASILTKLGL